VPGIEKPFIQLAGNLHSPSANAGFPGAAGFGLLQPQNIQSRVIQRNAGEGSN
jgi:hypothetical protein